MLSVLKVIILIPLVVKRQSNDCKLFLNGVLCRKATKKTKPFVKIRASIVRWYIYKQETSFECKVFLQLYFNGKHLQNVALHLSLLV